MSWSGIPSIDLVKVEFKNYPGWFFLKTAPPQRLTSSDPIKMAYVNFTATPEGEPGEYSIPVVVQATVTGRYAVVSSYSYIYITILEEPKTSTLTIPTPSGGFEIAEIVGYVIGIGAVAAVFLAYKRRTRTRRSRRKRSRR